MGSAVLRQRAFRIVTILCVHAAALSAGAQEPAQTQQGVITTFAPTVEKVAPSVVTVFTTQTVSRGLTPFPFSDDTFRQFLEDNFQGKANKRCRVSARA